DLPAQRFDGIFANASLFHIPAADLPRVLGQLRDSLKPGGVLFSSNPRGHNEEGWQGERYGVWYDWPTWQQLMTAAGFAELEHYYRPASLPRGQQPWRASFWRQAWSAFRDLLQRPTETGGAAPPAPAPTPPAPARQPAGTGPDSPAPWPARRCMPPPRRRAAIAPRPAG